MTDKENVGGEKLADEKMKEWAEQLAKQYPSLKRHVPPKDAGDKPSRNKQLVLMQAGFLLFLLGTVVVDSLVPAFVYSLVIWVLWNWAFGWPSISFAVIFLICFLGKILFQLGMFVLVFLGVSKPTRRLPEKTRFV